MALKLSKSQKLMIIIGISFSFFVAEIGVGFYTRSLALIADAFHYFNDLIGFIVALVAFQALSFGWQRATLLGAFFNGVFLAALGVSIFLQSVERFIAIERIENPKLVLIIGCIGLTLNIISASFLHEHDHRSAASDGVSMDGVAGSSEAPGRHSAHRHEASPMLKRSDHGHDLGIKGVLLHVMGDAANNVGVIIAATVIWQAKYDARFYADPAVSMAIAVMIMMTSVPLVRKTGAVLLESAPSGVNPDDVKHDIETIEGVLAVHELHIWRLNQQKAIASAHIVVPETTMTHFMDLANTINECFHAYGIHSVTVQPEVIPNADAAAAGGGPASRVDLFAEGLRQRTVDESSCMLGCRVTSCEDLTCCG